MHPSFYYEEKLSGTRLLRCYEIANPRIKQYLDAEIQFVISNSCDTDLVLELGCGYGRVMKAIAPFVSRVSGNDISRESLELAVLHLKPCMNCDVVQMDASRMGFDSCTFDLVFCIQNGISAFQVNSDHLIAESIRVTKEKGLMLFSSYSDRILEDRLDWFRKQSKMGLLGEIDEDKTRDGTIVCKDGFKATTVSGSHFVELFQKHQLDSSIVEVDGSSIFCKVRKK